MHRVVLGGSRWPAAATTASTATALRRHFRSTALRRQQGATSTRDVLAKYKGAAEQSMRTRKHVPDFKGQKARKPIFSDGQKNLYLAFCGIAPACLVYTMYIGSQVIKEIKEQRRSKYAEAEEEEDDGLSFLNETGYEEAEAAAAQKDAATVAARGSALARLEMQQAAVRKMREKLEGEIAQLDQQAAEARASRGQTVDTAWEEVQAAARARAAANREQATQPSESEAGGRTKATPESSAAAAGSDARLQRGEESWADGFMPAESFHGAIVGAEFKSGPLGLGYYRTASSSKALAEIVQQQERDDHRQRVDAEEKVLSMLNKSTR